MAAKEAQVPLQPQVGLQVAVQGHHLYRYSRAQTSCPWLLSFGVLWFRCALQRWERLTFHHKSRGQGESTQRLQCSSFLVMTYFLLRDHNVLPKKRTTFEPMNQDTLHRRWTWQKFLGSPAASRAARKESSAVLWKTSHKSLQSATAKQTPKNAWQHKDSQKRERERERERESERERRRRRRRKKGRDREREPNKKGCPRALLDRRRVLETPSSDLHKQDAHFFGLSFQVSDSGDFCMAREGSTKRQRLECRN